MSAKYMYKLSDENPDLQKQIGCMNGIFQLFDRHHFLGGSRRTASQNQKRLPSGQYGNHGNGIQPKGAPQKKTTEKKARALKEKHRTSTESSRTSFSSSSCSSSISSLECSRASQMEPSSFSQSAAPENHARNSHTYRPNASLQSRQQSLDLRDVVKDSINREARGLSVKTATTGEARGQTLKFIDSPRPLHYLNSVNPKDPGPRESFRVLHKLRESPSKSSEGKSNSLTGGLKDARRFSYDGRESRDTLKSTIKLKELPRLSLDSRAGSVRGSNPEMKSNFLSRDLGRDEVNSNSFLNNQQEPESNKRPSSVVAKLMGLEALPDPVSTSENQTAQIKTQLDEDKFLGSSRTTDLDKQNRISGSPRNLHKEPTSPSQRNAATAKKLTATSRFPIEPAPWRQPDGSRGSQAPAQKNQATLAKVPSSSLSVYGEIEKRLAQLQFQKSGKDLRALKQILEAMQKTKEIFETRKEDSRFENRTSIISSLDQSSKLAKLQELQSNSPISVPPKGTTSPKSFKSSIVIMKPAKLIGKAINPVSAINSTDSSSGIQRLRVATPENSRKESVDKQAAKDVSPRIKTLTDHSNKPLHRYPMDKNAGARSIRLAQPSKEIRSTTREATNSGKRSEIMNLRQQQKKLGFEKQSCPATASSESNRRRRQPGKQPTDSCSPHQKPRAKSLNLQPSDYELSDISDLRDSSHQSDAVSESNTSLASQYDDEVLSIDRSNKINKTFTQQAHLRQRNLVERSTKDSSIPEPRPASSEQPSPVSVLDAAFYGDELPSPIKKISIAFKDDEALQSDGVEWIPVDENYSFNSMNSSLYSMFNQKNGKSSRPLIQNLKEMLSTYEKYITDETIPFYNHANPDHQYISQIYLASGLHKDFESGLRTINLYPTSTPINPDIFHGLEQAKASSGHFNDDHYGKKISLSEAHAKIQRKLLFDVVNEILVHKLLSENSSKQWLSSKMLAGKGQKGQKLLGDLCSEIDRLQCLHYLLDDEDDNSRSIQWEDLVHESIHWTACHDEIQGIVLAVERLIFKDLITEVINSEMIGRQGRLAGHRRQLFPK
ncbi:hypothetical protein SADUNF_Sadunf17G0092300 [Salix dunnii]|uniref:DUF4378 domain-containing protein n=1 Tax=Salix dunnii TaxID=1413687 RepID=A0A835J6A0_9ROSI|nr:hypothetical protein SADUNF_Sadunf17G0092300 [Salix dunnii]